MDDAILPVEGKILIHVKNPKLALAEICNHLVSHGIVRKRK